MRLAFIALILFATQALAVNVYKCKGPNGEISFTETRCPDPETTEVHGTYKRAADAPTHYQPQEMESVSRSPQQVPSARSTKSERDIASDMASIANENPRSPLGDAARSARLRLENGRGPPSERAATYKREIAALQDIAAGRQPGNHASSGPEPSSVAVEQSSERRERAANDTPSRTRSCRADSAGGITCFDSEGKASHGRVDANGRANMNDGTTIQRRPDGVLRTTDGICVKDFQGQCQ